LAKSLVLGACAPGGGEPDEDGLPAPCSFDESLFEDAACLEALRLECNERATAQDCAAAPPFDFEGYGAVCTWANVVTYVDATSCAVQSESARCEAGVVPGDGLVAVCHAIPSQLEIIEIWGGPLGAWSAVGSDSDFVSSCGENLSPPEPPLCACAPASCAQEG
jgi:hypothetical protein